MVLELIDIFYIQGEVSLKSEIENFSLEDLINEYQQASQKFMACTEYHEIILKEIITKSKTAELTDIKSLISADFKKNGPNYLHNRLVAAYCQRIGVTLKELLEYRFILKKFYPFGYNFAVDFYIENECFKERSPIPAEDASIEYKRYVPKELKKDKKDIDFWIVNLLLKKMVIKEDEALEMYYMHKNIGHGFGMKIAASGIKKE